MTIRHPTTRVRIVIVFAAMMLAAGAATRESVAAAKPDVVVFLTDDQSQLDLTPYGGHGIRTPNMQRLADAGLTFNRAYVASPSCAPSRAALLTGLMPARNGAEANHSKPRAELKKLPAYFQELGYEVVAFGKVSHYRHTVDYGFDHFAHDTFHDHASIAAAVEYLKNRPREGAKPLCLFVGSNWPHVPWPETDLGYNGDKLTLPAGSIDTAVTRQWRARYAAAVTKGDDDLGRILDAAREYLNPNRLFLFSSDHGAQWPFAKWNCYEAGVCVPLLVAWPGVVKPGTRTDALVNWTDFLPTLLAAVGGTPPKDIDGRSFLPVLQGKTALHRERIFTAHSGDGRWNIYPTRAVRDGDWKYLRNLHPEFAFTTHIDLRGELGQRSFFSSWETAAQDNSLAAGILNRYHARPAEELYDLRADPHEQHNLADKPEHRGQLNKLSGTLDQWLNEQGDRLAVFAEPRLLSDPGSFGPNAPPGNQPAAKAAKKASAKENSKAKTKRKAAAARPNIVLIISDDHAWTDYGFMGHPLIQTPNLDELAARSTVFTRGHVPTALCRPSLATLATGLYAHQHMISGNDPSPALAKPASPDYAVLRERLISHMDRQPTLPKLLGDQGYLSFQTGKWWEGSYQRGGFTHGMTRGFPQPGGRHGDEGLKIGREGLQPVFDFVTRAVAEQKPFFLWYAPFLPHSPHNPPERLLAKYRDKVDSLHVAQYYAMCEWFDESCGELMHFIDRQGLTKNTLFVYIADNGWIQDPNSNRYALRSKQSANEGGVRQPIMLSWPGVIPAGKRNELVSSIDLMPTILRAAGANVPENLPGLDLMPVARDGKPLGRDVLFGETFAHDIADLDKPEASLIYRWAIEGRWKLLLTYDGTLGRYASSHPRTEPRPQLYDLDADPHELRNLAAQNPEIVDRLAAKIDGWWPVTERKCMTRWTE